ncbi:MAG: MFS transporter [Thermoleophilia bacterium]|nr:MFS transporter [Thermoleophilia bacterium]
MTTRPWLVLGAVALGNLVVAALHFGLAAAAPVVRDQLDIGTAVLGLVLASPAIGLMLGTYGWGVLSDHTSERRVLTGAFVGFAAVTFAGASALSARDPLWFTIAILGSGLFGSAAHSAGGRAISAAFPVERHGLVLSIRHVAIPIGAALGGVVVPLTANAWGLPFTLFCAGVAGVVAAIGMAWLVPSSRSRAARAARAESAVRGSSPLRLPRMWLLAAGAGSLAFVQLGIGSFLTVQLVDRADTRLAVAAGIFTIAQLAGAAGRIILGVVSDRARSRVDVLLAVAGAVGVLVIASMAAPGGMAPALLQAAALVVVTSCNGVVVAVAASFAPVGRTGATLGMQTTANALACSIAPIMLGVVLARSTWLAYELVLLAAVVVSLFALGRLRGATGGSAEEHR